MFYALGQSYYRYLLAIIYPEKNQAHCLITPVEAVLLSWPSVVVGSILNLLAMFVLLKVFVPSFSLDLSTQGFHYGTLDFHFSAFIFWGYALWQLMQLIFFPVFALIRFWLWKVTLSVYQYASFKSRKSEEEVDRDLTFPSDISSCLLATTFLDAVPLGFFSFAMGIYVLWRSMALRLGYEWWAILLVIVTPRVLILGLILSVIFLAITSFVYLI